MMKNIKYAASLVAAVMVPLVGVLQAVNTVLPIEHLDVISQIMVSISAVISVVLGANTFTKIQNNKDKMDAAKSVDDLKGYLDALSGIIDSVRELEDNVFDAIEKSKQKDDKKEPEYRKESLKE